MVEAYLKMWKNYAVFNGRAKRSDYWWTVLANIIVSFILGILIALLPGLVFLSYVYSIAALLPGLGLTVRRLHDVGKSGWFILIGLIPLIGEIILIVFLATAGEAGANRWGEAPA